MLIEAQAVLRQSISSLAAVRVGCFPVALLLYTKYSRYHAPSLS